MKPRRGFHASLKLQRREPYVGGLNMTNAPLVPLPSRGRGSLVPDTVAALDRA